MRAKWEVNMMEANFLCSVIDNFRKQYRLYCEMRGLALKQKECLTDGKNADMDEFIAILRQREQIMLEISYLNEENIKLRQAVISELEVTGFKLSELKGKVEKGAFEELKGIINDLNRVLLDISEIDHYNTVIIKDLWGLRYRNSQSSYKAAQELYNKTMKSNL